MNQKENKCFKIIKTIIGIIGAVCGFIGFTVFHPFSLFDFKGNYSFENDSYEEPLEIDGSKLNIYNNSLIVEVRRATLFAKDINGNYLGITYDKVDLNEEMSCVLSNERNTYDGKIDKENFNFNNIEPGIYELKFTSRRYMESIMEVTVEENSQIKNIIKTQDAIIGGVYEEYVIFFDNHKNVEYIIKDYEGQQEQIESTFCADSKGGFYFMVDWSKNININIFIKGKRLTVPFEKRFNNTHFTDHVIDN